LLETHQNADENACKVSHSAMTSLQWCSIIWGQNDPTGTQCCTMCPLRRL